MLAYLHADDHRLPEEGWSASPTVSNQLSFTQKMSDEWESGEDEPAAPNAPVIVDNPGDDAAKNTAPDSGGIAMVAEWSSYGWTWVGLLDDDSNLNIDINGIVQWSPDDGEAKTGAIALTWQIGIARRKKKQFKKYGNPWEDLPLNNQTVEVWTKWMPAG